MQQLTASTGITLEDDRVWWSSVVGMLLLALFCATYALDLYPLEAHEIFVAQSAIEMAERGDWVVPYFNGEPRLNKPPLNYWLTGLASWVDGTRVESLHARLPSALAGVGLVGLTLLLGRSLFGRATAISAGLILICSAGFLQYTHNARPEMLYALWCTAGVTAFVGAWKAADRIKIRWLAAHAIWLCFGLATLTKGPQIPAMFLLVFGWSLARERVGWRQAGQILQPFSGLMLALAITLPWWWLLKQHLGPEALAGSQLSGALLSPALVNVLDPYYLYRTPQLALPWLILFPVAVVMTATWTKGDRGLLLLLGLILLPALLLSLGPQRRWYYMLPSLAPMCLLLAATLERLFALHNPRAPLRRWMAVALPGQWLLALALLLGAALWTDDQVLGAQLLAALVVLALLGAGFRWWGARRTAGPLFPVATSATLFLAITGVVYSVGQDLLRAGKEDRLEVARFLASEVSPAIPLATLGTGNETYVHYAARRVRHMASPSEIQAALDDSESSQLILVLRRSRLGALPNARRSVLFQSDAAEDDPLLVVLLESPTGLPAPREGNSAPLPLPAAH